MRRRTFFKRLCGFVGGIFAARAVTIAVQAAPPAASVVPAIPEIAEPTNWYELLRSTLESAPIGETSSEFLNPRSYARRLSNGSLGIGFESPFPPLTPKEQEYARLLESQIEIHREAASMQYRKLKAQITDVREIRERQARMVPFYKQWAKEYTRAQEWL